MSKPKQESKTNMSKTTNAKSYAEEGLEDIQQYSAEAEEAVNGQNTGSAGEDEFFQVGGADPVDFFYRLNAPKKPTTSAWKLLEQDHTVVGTLVRTFESTGGKFKKTDGNGNVIPRVTYIVKGDDGKTFGLPNAGQLDKRLAQLAIGSKVKITYLGMEAIKNGEYSGTDAHQFSVLGNKRKQQTT